MMANDTGNSHMLVTRRPGRLAIFFQEEWTTSISTGKTNHEVASTSKRERRFVDLSDQKRHSVNNNKKEKNFFLDFNTH